MASGKPHIIDRLIGTPSCLVWLFPSIEAQSCSITFSSTAISSLPTSSLAMAQVENQRLSVWASPGPLELFSSSRHSTCHQVRTTQVHLVVQTTIISCLSLRLEAAYILHRFTVDVEQRFVTPPHLAFAFHLLPSSRTSLYIETTHYL